MIAGAFTMSKTPSLALLGVLLLCAGCSDDEPRTFSGSGGSAGVASGGSAGTSTGGSGGVSGAGTGGNGGASDAGTGGSSGAGGSGGTDAGSDASVDAGPSEKVLYDFFAHGCDPTWLESPDLVSAATPVECNKPLVGASVQLLAAAVLEGGITESMVLRVHPPITKEGVTSAQFTGLSLVGSTKPMFKVRLGCPDASPSCNVKWQVLVHKAGASGLPELFKEGTQTNDKKVDDLEIDLAAYAGQALDISLAVTANGSASVDDVLLWAGPRLVDVQP